MKPKDETKPFESRLIEDYAKGELGNDITKLRVKIDKLLQRNKES